MAGIDAVEPAGSTALLGVDFEFEKTDTDPSLALVDCQISVPAGLFKGCGRSAVAATEPPGAVLSNHLLFIRIRDRPHG